MDDLFEEPTDATPLAPDERKGLIPSDRTYRHELNKAEQENIARAHHWALSPRRSLLTEKFIKDLHGRMFGDVWRWAGQFRTSERNIGIPHYQIPMALRDLLADARTWVEHSAYPPDEIAIRFHHRLVQIHPFPNGNGRHSRLSADLLIMKLGGERFAWGSANLEDAGEVRRRYIKRSRQQMATTSGRCSSLHALSARFGIRRSTSHRESTESKPIRRKGNVRTTVRSVVGVSAKLSIANSGRPKGTRPDISSSIPAMADALACRRIS